MVGYGHKITPSRSEYERDNPPWVGLGFASRSLLSIKHTKQDLGLMAKEL